MHRHTPSRKFRATGAPSRWLRCSFFKYGPDILSRRALPSWRLAGLGARRAFHHGLLAALICACGAGARVSAQSSAPSSATFPSSVARVDVAVGEDGRATVRETFQLHGIPAAVSFRAPAAASAPLAGVTATLDERHVPLASSGDGPWQTFQLTAPADASTVGPASRPSTLVVSYSTRLGARHSTLPLLVPAAALQRAPDSRGAVVDFNVTFAGDSGAPGGARVRLPRRSEER